MKTIRGKKALVTGAASGIGRAIALALAREGADLFLLDIDAGKLAEVVAETGQMGILAVGILCDLACPEQCTAAVRQVLQTGGPLDLLVNNAGVAYFGPTERMTPEQWSRLLRINLLAPIQLTHELLPTLRARPEAHVLNVCSVLGLVAIKKLAAYQVSKFGLVGFSESLRAEFGGSNLGVTAFCPGFVRTNLNEAMMHPLGAEPRRLPPSWLCTSPETVAARAVKAIYKNRGLVLVTPLARAVWLLKRVSPGLWEYLVRPRKKQRTGTALVPGHEASGVPPELCLPALSPPGPTAAPARRDSAA